jgi:hypothetical protein
VPLKAIVWGLAEELLVISTEPVRGPAADGVNEIEMEQVVLIATRLPQVSLTGRKSPVTEKPEMASGAVPGLVSVTVWTPLVVPRGTEPKDTEVPERVDMEVPALPVSEMDCAAALLLKEAVPVRAPSAVGTKMNETVQ